MDDLRRAFSKILQTKQQAPTFISGVLGNWSGIVEVPNRPGYCYVRINDQISEIINKRTPYWPELSVNIGIDPFEPGVTQVLGVIRTTGSGLSNIPTNGSHGSTHSAWGRDPVPIWSQQWMPGRVTAYGDFNIVIYPLVLYSPNSGYSVVVKAETPVDLESDVPITADKSLWVLVTVDKDGVVVYTVGDEADSDTFDNTYMPAVPADTVFLLAAIRLYEGQTFIAEVPDNSDIIDLRFAAWSPSYQMVLNDLVDVNAPSPADLEIITWDNASSKYIPRRIQWTDILGVPFFQPLYFHTEEADIATYEQLLSMPSDDIEVEEQTILDTADGEVLIDAYISYPTAGLGITRIEAGIWEFIIYGKVDTVVGSSEILIYVYKRSSGGTETELFNTTTGDLTATTAEYDVSYPYTAVTLDVTDRIVVKLYAVTTSVPDRTISFYYEGTTHPSHVLPPTLSSGGATLPFTAAGDLLTYDGDNNTALPVGDEGQVLTVVSGVPAWADNQDSGSSLSPYKHLIASNGYTAFATENGFQNAVVEWGGKTFMFYFADDRDNWGVEYDHEAQTFSDPVEVADGHTADDTHQYASAIVDNLGYIHLAYGCHGSALYYKHSTNPGDITSWTTETTIATYATYPRWVKDSSGNLYVFYREGVGGININHRYYRYRKTTDRGATFETAVTLVDSGNNGIFIYGCIGIGPDDTIHVSWSYRTYVALDPSEFEGVYYAQSSDGGTTWTKSDGVTSFTLPIGPATDEQVASGIYKFTMGVTGDEYGNPQLVYALSDSGSFFVINQIHYCYVSGGTWQDVTLDTAYVYDFPKIVTDGSNLYIFTTEKVGTYKEVVFWQSLDAGATWTKYQLTSSSAADNLNVAIKHNSVGGLEFIWGKGTNVYYLNKEWIDNYLIANPAMAINLDDLQDVTITTPAANDVLTYNGSNWINQAAQSIGQYKQFLWDNVGGNLTFLTDPDGNPLFVLLDLE